MTGGFRKERKDFISVTPDDLRMFDETDISKTFDYLEKEFHLSKEWQKEYRKQLNYMTRSMSAPEFFFRFATQHIDPGLKIILKRDQSVIFAMCRFIVRVKAKGIEHTNY